MTFGITPAKRWLLQRLVAEFPAEAARLAGQNGGDTPSLPIGHTTDAPERLVNASLLPDGYRPGVDWLTGLPDRHALVRRLHGLRNARAGGVLATIDLDQFKQVNAIFGHRVGDEVLCRFAREIRRLGPERCELARLGGDEFLLYFPQADLAGAEADLRMVAAAIKDGITVSDGTRVLVTFSAGLARFGIATVEQALADCDTAMQAAKLGGRNDIVVADGVAPPMLTGRGALAAAVIELQQKIRELQTESRTDALTGLHNRRALDEVLDVAPASQDYKWSRTMVAFMDLDYFGDVNKLYGDATGDAVLARVAAGLRGCLRPEDLLFRKGGEEFVAVLPDEQHHDAAAWGERLRRAVEDLAIPHAGSLASSVVTITIGVASGSASRTVRELMYAASELAMRAKRTGQRNRVHLDALDP